MYRNRIALMLLITFSFLICSSSQAQRERVWVFGNVHLDFSTTPPTSSPAALSSGTLQNYGEACASICDAAGNLQFYTDGTYVFNRQHQLMPNGNGIVPLPVPSFYNYTATSSSAQGTLIVPHPLYDSLYYVFSLYSWEQQDNYGKLYYSIVDMSLDGGLGDVLPASKGILIDTGFTERMTAITGDGCFVWLSLLGKDGQLYCYKIDDNGLHTTPTVSNLGLSNNYSFNGKLEASPDGSKIAIGQFFYLTGFPGIALASFDPASGSAGTAMQLFPNTASYGLCFSHNSRYLYYHTLNFNFGIYQIGKLDVSNFNTASILNSDLILNTDVDLLTSMKRGADSNIYFMSPLPNSGLDRGLSIIHNANLPGTATTVQHNAVTISSTPGFTPYLGIGLPNVIVANIRDTLENSEVKDVCMGRDTVYPSDRNGYDFQWSDGVQSAFRTDFTQSGLYWVRYRKNACVYAIDTFHLNVREPIRPEYYDTICKTGSLVFNGKTLTEAGTYSDTFAAANNCDSIVTLHLSHFEPTEATISFAPKAQWCLGDTIVLQSSPAATYRWMVNNAIKGTKDSLHLPILQNRLDIQLSLIDSNQCVANASLQINSTECCNIVFPNAFSPNNDGINDVFVPLVRGYCMWQNAEWYIYNRWGQQVFFARGSQILSGWDGSFNSQYAPAGVYMYLLKYKLPYQNKTMVLKGDLSLIR
jgi:gliding motility-associated-like protein